MLRQKMMGIVLGIALAGYGATALAQVKMPETAADHMTLAKKYQDQADAARKQATEHREMLEASKSSASNSQEKRGDKRDPQVAKMVKHCTALAAAADKLAQENQKAADFHTERGKELQGQ